ncbi:DUF6470 family protein [Paenibacillus sp. GYB003]|uniref:DUF6470 family protein n=1 Tax=Paenibacillus sp. GYB003 TaxID=2994392 RepID=UPI002F961F76
MSSVSMIQIRQVPAKLSIDADLGKQDIRQPRATFELEADPPKVEIRQHRGELEIDQGKAWDALGMGNILESMRRIASQAHNVALQGIARIVENGNRLAQIHLDTNPIAENAEQLKFEHFEFDYYGPASYDNVDITYTARKPDILPIEGKVRLNTHPNKPEIDYARGKLDIYMVQYPKVEITPPRIDLKL